MSGKKTALILHGFPGLAKDSPILEYFSRRGYKTVVPELLCTDCKFTKDELITLISQSMGDRPPDVILGVSMGGLILPLVAGQYPNAKLILIATGTKVDVKIPAYNLIVRSGNSRLLKTILPLAKSVPVGLYKSAYHFLNPYKGKKENKNIYEQNILNTFSYFKNVPDEKLGQVAEFFKSYDSSDLLKPIGNKALILSGGRDVMMSQSQAENLRFLIKNSILIENKDRLHYDVFNNEDFAKLDEFLK